LLKPFSNNLIQTRQFGAEKGRVRDPV